MFKLDQKPTNVPKIRRLVAYLLDVYIGTLVMLLPIVYFWMQQTKDIDSVSTLDLWKFANKLGVDNAIIFGLIGVLFAFIYYIIIPIIWQGQTVGKKIMKLRIVNIDDSNVKTNTIIVRQLIGIIILEGFLYSVSDLIRNIISLYFKINITGIGLYIAIFITIISIILLYKGKSNRMLHDYIAKTKVIYEN